VPLETQQQPQLQDFRDTAAQVPAEPTFAQQLASFNTPLNVADIESY
jgi:hypothetical protein